MSATRATTRQVAEVRHLHLVEGVPKKEIALRLEMDVKTAASDPPVDAAGAAWPVAGGEHGREVRGGERRRLSSPPVGGGPPVAGEAVDGPRGGRGGWPAAGSASA